MAEDEKKGDRIEAISGVNPRGEGFVHIAMDTGPHGRVVVQATPAEARQIGQQIIEGAEAADTDAFLFQFLQRKIGVDREAAARVLVDFREWRQLSGGVKSRDKDDPHWEEMAEKNGEETPWQK